MNGEVQLILVSNRGPATFERGADGELYAQRGTGGLVTALTGLVHHRDALWVASAMTDADVEMSRRHGGRSFSCEVEGTTYRVRLVESDPEAYDQFYNVIANPLLWFIQHYLWDLSNAPDIRRQEVAAYELGYRAVNEDLARAVLDEVESDDAVVLLHDYHLCSAPRVIRQARPDLFLWQEWAVVKGGDDAQTAINRAGKYGIRYNLEKQIIEKHEPVIEIYRRVGGLHGAP